VNPAFQAQAGKQTPFYDRWGYDPTGAARSLGRFPRPTKFLFDMLIANDDTLRLKRLAYGIGGENGSAPGTSKLVEVVSNYKAVPFGAGSGHTGPATLSGTKYDRKRSIQTSYPNDSRVSIPTGRGQVEISRG
jgi:hypothetical protein